MLSVRWHNGTARKVSGGIALHKHRTPVDGLRKHDTRDDIPLCVPYFFCHLPSPLAAACHLPQKCIGNKGLHTLTAYTYHLSSSYVSSSFPPRCCSRCIFFLHAKIFYHIIYIFYLMIKIKRILNTVVTVCRSRRCWRRA